MRKELSNYLLPSECLELLQSLVGKQLLSAKIGLARGESPNGSHAEAVGPIFLTVTKGEIIVINYDDFTASLAVRKMTVVDALQINPVDQLYLDDSYVPRFLRIEKVSDVAYALKYIGLKINGVALYKYPTNHFGKPIGYDYFNETALELKFLEKPSLVIGYSLQAGSNRGALAVVGWENIPADRLEGLERVFSVD